MRVSVNGIRMFFDVEGALHPANGPELDERQTLLLIHGGPGFDHATFKPYFSRFTDKFQVVYVDLRANGRSDSGSEDSWTLSQWADDIKAFCDATGIKSPIVLGVSFGGFVAMKYASKYPDAPSALVILNSAARTVLDRKLDAFEKLGGAEARAAADVFWRRPEPAAVEKYMEICMPLYTPADHDPEAGARATMRLESFFKFAGEANEMFTYDLRDDLGHVRCQALVVTGDQDPVTPVADSEEIMAALPPGTASLRIIEGAGHSVERAKPEEFEKILRQFVAEIQYRK